jgi:hypothetical protein
MAVDWNKVDLDNLPLLTIEDIRQMPNSIYVVLRESLLAWTREGSFRRPDGMIDLHTGSCMWCGKVFNNRSLLEAHEDGCM